MSTLATRAKEGLVIAKALGLPLDNLLKFQLVAEAREPLRVIAEYLLEIETAKVVAKALIEYQVVPLKAKLEEVCES